MSQAIYTVGPEGKRILESLYGHELIVDRKPPIQRNHFLAINDLRIAAELAGSLRFFYAAWQLPSLGWSEVIIPDALLAFDSKNIALEFDTGAEGIKYFMRTKMTMYRRGFDSIPIHALIIVADRTVRMLALAKAIADQYGKVLFTTLEMIQRNSLASPIFYIEPHGWGVSLFETLSSQTVLATGEVSTSNNLDFSNLEFQEQGLLRQEREGAGHDKTSD